MSNITIIAINHDMAGDIEANKEVFIDKLLGYLRSLNQKDRLDLRYMFGVHIVATAHHADKMSVKINSSEYVL